MKNGKNVINLILKGQFKDNYWLTDSILITGAYLTITFFAPVPLLENYSNVQDYLKT
jgi:hypothetical protein